MEPDTALQIIGLSEPWFALGDNWVTYGQALLAALFALALLVLLIWRSSQRRAGERLVAAREAQRLAEERASELQTRMADVQTAQSQIAGQMQAFASLVETRQADMARSVSERLDGMSQRMGQTMAENTKNTTESLAGLQERLAVIDKAQSNITALSDQVSGLQSILSNKQTRGAFGQTRMETIIADGLPQGAYAFQYTLSNGKKPDCLIFMPNDTPPLAIDAKFPLEGWNAMRDAEAADQDVQPAMKRFTADMDVHIKAISEKYLIAGETQDTAFLFVPSESIFADIHERFETVVQKAHRARVVIVSPSLLMLSIQVVQSVLKDARMREQAHLIQREVGLLMDDVRRVDERVEKLATHFRQAQKDVELIQTSTGKLTRRGEKIGEWDMEPDPKQIDAPAERDLLSGS
ncbi:MAG: DNA recombination protein RmuC [Pseudomonadota bacterium]